MRQAITLVLLLGGMRMILPLGVQGQGSEALLSFGFLILAAHVVGDIAAAGRLPKIFGYLMAGVLFGPSVLGIVTEQAVTRLTPVSELAVALIAFLAGAELRWAQVREEGMVLTKIMLAELATCFSAITLLMFGMRSLLPPLSGLPALEVLVVAMVFSAIAIVHSPAVTMALLSETRARGPVGRTTLGVVLLADVVVVILFSGTLALARIVSPAEGAAASSIGLVLWEVGGAIVVGAVLGGVVALYLRFVGKELVLFGVLVALFGTEIAHLARVELLLALLTAGFVAENVTSHGGELREAMGRSAAPIFVVFFALSGSHIDLPEVAPLLPLVVPIALVRMGAIATGVRIGSAWARHAPADPRHVWKGLVSQAGVAIGLAAILAQAYPQRGAYLAGLLLALIAINESVGPILFRRALTESDEVARAGAAGRPPELRGRSRPVA